jgi:hypothetical protein
MTQASQAHKLIVHGRDANDNVLPRNITAIPQQDVTASVAFGPVDLGASTYWSDDTTVTLFAIEGDDLPTGLTLSTAGALSGTTAVTGTTTHRIVATGDTGITVRSNQFDVVVT